MADLAETVEAITGQHRRRVFAMEQRKRSNLALASFLRMALGWSRALPDDERKAINDHALRLVKMGEIEWRAKQKDRLDELITDDDDYIEWSDVILSSVSARAPFDAVEKAAEKEMARLAKTLPVWEWCEGIRGFGAVSLAVIVAEAGDLGNYPKKGHLWKRMGLAVLDGVRQGGLTKTAPKELWIAHGYNRQRRSRMWNIGDSLIKGNGDGFYRQYYLERKQIEREKAEARGLTVCPSAKIPEKRKAEFISDGHIHRRAQRKMEIRLLTDLWRTWRGDAHGFSERTTATVPTAETLIEETAHAAH